MKREVRKLALILCAVFVLNNTSPLAEVSAADVSSVDISAEDHSGEESSSDIEVVPGYEATTEVTDASAEESASESTGEETEVTGEEAADEATTEASEAVVENSSEENSDDSSVSATEPAIENEESVLLVQDGANSATSGSCGESAKWNYDATTHKLTVSGSGYMSDYTSGNPAPWESYASEITAVEIGSGITKVGSYSFYKYSHVSDIKMADTVKIIGKYAFYAVASDDSLKDADTKIVFPSKLEVIEEYAFSSAKYLKINAAKLPKSLVTLGNAVFSGDRNLTGSFTAGDNLIEIGYSCFASTELSGTLTLNKSVSVIRDRAFECTDITSLVLGNSVRTIEMEAFQWCYDLDINNIVFPDSVEYIGRNAFHYCKTPSKITFGKGLKHLHNFTQGFVDDGYDYITLSPVEVHFKGNMPALDDNTVFGGFEVLAYYPADDPTWTEEAINVFSKKFFSVRWCQEGKKPAERTSNITWSFDEETATLTLSGSGDMLDYSASRPAPWIEYANVAQKIVIKDGITSIGVCAFQKFYKTETILVGNTLRSVSAHAFNGTNITEIIYPETLEYFNLSSIYCTRTKKITFLGDAPALYTADFIRATVPQGITVYYNPDKAGWTQEYADTFMELYSISKDGFFFRHIETGSDEKCGDNITWHVKERTSGYYSRYSTAKKTLVLEGTGDMYDYSLMNAAPWVQYSSEITEVVIGKGITHIGDHSFKDLSLDADLTIPRSVKTIGDYAFHFTTTREHLIVEEGTQLDSVGSRAFWHFSGRAGVTGMGKAIQNASVIHDRAFSGSSYMDFQDLYLNVKVIEPWAFNTCEIETLTLGDKVERVESAAFYNCNRITSIDLGKSVKFLGNAIFYSVTVDTYTIPDSVVEAESAVCPTNVKKAIYVGKNIKTAYALTSTTTKDIDFYFSGDCPEKLSLITGHRYNIYYPRYNASWLYALDELGETVATFIPLGEEKEVFLTVKFNTGCATVIPDKKVPFGERIAEPEVTNGDMIFDGWFTDTSYKTRFNFASKVGENMTLYAHWHSPSAPVVTDDWGDILEADRKNKGYSSVADVPAGLWYCYPNTTFTYNGNAHKLSYIRVYEHTRLLKETKDYIVRYYNNINAGTAYALLTYKGDHKGNKKLEFTINPSPVFGYSRGITNTIGGVTYRLEYEKELYFAYTGKVIKAKPVFKVYRNGKAITLRENVDYTVTYSDSDDYTRTGMHSIKVSGKGNYAANNRYFSFIEYIQKGKLITKATVSKIPDQDYTGEDITVSGLKVKFGGKLLQEGTDYTLDYGFYNHKDPGITKVIIVGRGEYAGRKEVSFKIKGKPVKDWVIVGFQDSRPCESTVYQRNYTIYKNEEDAREQDPDKALRSYTDYSVSYLNNTRVGTATMIITGAGIYEGTIKKTFKITGHNLARCKVYGLSENYFYDGAPHDPTNNNQYFKVVCSGETLTYHYKKQLSDNVNAGKGKITLTGVYGAYGTKVATFNIKPFEVTQDNCSVSYESVSTTRKVRIILDKNSTYTKGMTTPVPRIYFKNANGETVPLNNGKDFTLSYKNNRVPGTATMTITFKGNFKGKINTTYEITASDIANCSASATNVAARKKAGLNKPVITVKDSNGRKLAAGRDFSKKVVYRYENGTEVDESAVIPAGTVITAEVSGMGLYEGKKPIRCSFRVTDSRISSARITFNTTYVYTGKEIKPGYSDFKVTIGKKELTSDDYEIISYSNNIKAGTATMVIKGKGRVDGTSTVKFKINKNTNL